MTKKMNREKLPNLKALGIEKDMNNEFESIPKTELQTLIDSSYFQNPHIANRPEKGEYCEIEVLDCENESWWYKDLIGYRFFCEIVYGNFGYGRYIKEFLGVKLTNNKTIVFRSFSPKDVIII